jgi:thiamine biosynthesis lipoprotein
MGTTVSQKLYGRHARAAAGKTVRQIARLERRWSIFRASSELRSIAAAAGRHPVLIHPDTLRLLQRAVELGELSGGRFDITAGAVTRLWRAAAEHGAPPPPAQIAERLRLVDWRELHLDPERPSAYLPRAGQQLDPGGIGKGFAADRARRLYRRYGIRHGFINLGGNVLTFGGRPDGAAWKVGIRAPASAPWAPPRSGPTEAALIGYVEVRDAAVVTSGDYEACFEHGGRRYHHIINPRTGYPTATDTVSATIVAPTATDADALATAVLLMGSAEGLDLIDRLPVAEALLVGPEGRLHLSKGMGSLLKRSPLAGGPLPPACASR